MAQNSQRQQMQNASFVVQAWRWGGWIIGVALSFGARQLIVTFGVDGVIEGVLKAVGVGLLTGGICLFLVWLGYIVWWIWPSQRFRRMEGDLIVASNGVESSQEQPENVSSIRSIVRKLDKLKIPHPDMKTGYMDWRIFLKRLIGEARAGALKEARLVWPEIAGRE